MRTGFPFISMIVEFLGRRRSPPSVDFSENEVVKSFGQFKIPWGGEYLNLPPNVAVVISFPDGQQRAYQTGGILNLPMGVYGRKFVDMSRRYMNMPRVKATTSDSWTVSLQIEVTWQVSDPLMIANTKKPIHALRDLCRAATIDFIQSNPHDLLVSSPEVEPMEEEKIANSILKRIRKNPALVGFNFVNINVLDRRGDPKRLEKRQAGMVQLEEIERKVAVEDKRSSLAEKEIITKKKAELTQAEFDAQIARMKFPAEELRVQIQNLSKKQGLQQERYIEALSVLRDTLGDYLGLLKQAQLTPGLQPRLDKKALEPMTEAMRAFLDLNPSLLADGEILETSRSSSSKDQDKDPDILPAVHVRDKESDFDKR